MRRLWLCALIPLIVAVDGCTQSLEPLTLSAGDTTVAGLYGLTDAGGQSLPILAGVTATQQVDLVADTMSIVNDNTWKETSYYVLTAFADGTTSNAQTVSSGTYALAGGKITFTMLVGGTVTFTGSVSGTSLSLLYNNAIYFYSR